MSKFFKALDQAGRERILRERGSVTATDVEPTRLAERREPAEQAWTESPTAPAPPPERGASRFGPEPALDRTHESVEGFEGMDEGLVTLLAPNTFEAEQYGALRHVVEHRHKADALTVVAISSPAHADGKTTTAINLAGTLAQAPSARVLLVDADLRAPSVARALGMSAHGDRGLVDAIVDHRLSLDDVARHRPPFNLWVVPAGPPPPTRYELLASPRLGNLLEAARRRYDYVVIDTPPLVPVPDCRVIARWVDGFLVVIAAHKTPRKLLEEALNAMDPANVVGLVFNGDDRPAWNYHRASAAARRVGRR